MTVGQTVLWGAVLVSAVLQLSVVTWNRELLQVWQKADAERQALAQEYSRLVLEKSTLTAHGRIDALARKRLGMQEPEHTQVFH